MNQVDKELMQEKGILTENEKADEYEIQKAAMKEAVFFLAAMLEKNLDMSELQTISLYLKELSMKQHYMHIHLYVQQLYRNSRPHGGKCILQIRGARPFFSDKYDITKHPNYRYLSDADPKNWFRPEIELNPQYVPKPEEEVEVTEIDLTQESE